MELRTAHVTKSNCGGYFSTVFGGSEKAFSYTVGIVGMNEVNEIAVLRLFENRVLLFNRKRIPSDMRNFQFGRKSSLH